MLYYFLYREKSLFPLVSFSKGTDKKSDTSVFLSKLFNINC